MLFRSFEPGRVEELPCEAVIKDAAARESAKLREDLAKPRPLVHVTSCTQDGQDAQGKQFA